MTFFLCVGAIYKIFGNIYGYGDAFDEAFMTITLIGMLSLSPLIVEVLKPIIVANYEFLGADLSMIASTILAYYMGGYDLAIARRIVLKLVLSLAFFTVQWCE